MNDPPLFHFSEDPGIEVFRPRPVRVPSQRPPGLDWHNGPLVWAVDEWHSPMFFFPRDCPRVLLWRTPQTTDSDLDHWWRGDRGRRMQAHIEAGWLGRLRTTRLYRYAFDAAAFERIDADGGPGYYVARSSVRPLERAPLDDLEAALEGADVELHVMDDLLPFNGAWESSVHFSGSRLRNAIGWEERDTPTPLPPRLQLRTKRLTLRPFEVADAARVTEIVDDWEVARMLRFLPWPTGLALQRQWLASQAAEWRAGAAYRFAIVRCGRLVGCVDVDEIAGGEGELGYWLERVAWGQGFAAEASCAVIDFAFERLGLRALRSGHAADNGASGRVLAKVGFEQTGEGQVWSKPRNSKIPQLWYRLPNPARTA
jgi:RimJ/RimL family protein N-acetyltransferase